MSIIRHKSDAPVMAVTLIAIAITLLFSAVFPASMPWSLLILAGFAGLVYWVTRWDVMLLTWVWVGSFGLLDWGDLTRIEITGFFNLTPPRIIFLITIFAYLMYFMVRQTSFKFDRKVFWIMLGLLAYFAVSAQLAGWTTDLEHTKTSPYFRFIGSILLPFTMMFLVYNVTRDERQALVPFILASVFGWYTIWLGFMQFGYIKGIPLAGELIWPKILLDPNYGIHIERGRGAFAAAGPQSIFLVMLFFMNLYSLRRIKGGYKYFIMVQNVLIIPAIFFTGIRAGYVAFLVCGFIWCVWASVHRIGLLRLALMTVVILIGIWVFWDNLASKDRSTGGVAQVKPILARKILLAQSWETFVENPATGVGFGHWAEYQYNQERDTTTLSGMQLGLVLSQHNLFLVVLTETGIIGFVGLVAVFVGVFINSLHLYRRLPETAQGNLSREYVVVFWIILANYLISSMFRDLLWDLASNAMLWSMAGLVLGYHRQLEPHTLDLPAASEVWSS